MYLSVLRPDPRVRAVRTDLGNSYELHRTLLRAFEEPVTARPLWRCDLGRDKLPEILVQSRIEPRWDRLLEREPQYFIEPPCHKPFAPPLQRGMRLAFRLRANASVKRMGKRRGLSTREEQFAWLRRQGERCGFVVFDVVLEDERLAMARKAEHRIQLGSAAYEGVLGIWDVEPFRLALENGIGHAKGLGFGLLSIAPAG